MKSSLLSKSESAALLADVSGSWGLELPRTKNLAVYDLGGGASLVAGSGFRALRLGQGAPAAGGGGGEGGAAAGGESDAGSRPAAAKRPPYLPFLSEDALLARFPAVTVDMGAVRFVCKGANVMRPGIKAMDDFDSDRIVCVREESLGKYLAVGTSSVSSAEAAPMQRGQVVSTLHYVSDRYWESARPALGRKS